VAFKTITIISNVVRAKEIVATLIRNGFDELLEQLDLPSTWLARFVPKRKERHNIWERIRITCEDLGPTFVKFAQLLSTRSDVLPEPLIREFKKLRKGVRPLPFEVIEPVLLEELQCPLEDLFSEFDKEAVACASLGQVYRGRLKRNNEEVAIKVQKPGSIRALRSDLEIMGWFARKIHQRVDDLKPYDLPAVIEEAARALMNEIDYTIEARNAMYFNRTNPYKEKVFAPKVYEDISTSKILITEWVSGCSPEEAILSKEEAHEYANIGAKSVLHQIVITGFFHADPHSGNIILTDDGRLCFLDWGQIGHLTRKMRYFLADLFSAIATLDSEKVVQVAVAKAIGKIRMDESKLEKEVGFILRKYQDLEVHNMPFGRVITDLLFVLGVNGLHLAKDYAMLGKAVMAIEDVGKTLDPDFDVREIAAPFLKKLTWERWNPTNLLQQIYWSCQVGITRLRNFPGAIERLLGNLEDGKLGISLHHKGLDSLEKTLSTSANRIVMALVIAALIIGSSTVITTGVEPFIWGYPSIGIVGFMLSGVIGLYLVWDILRHGRHK